MSDPAIHVVKLGGSLLDPGGPPAMLERFERWRRAEMGLRGLLVVGGGAAADIVRNMDAAFGLDQEQAHWLAIRAMEFNAFLVAAALKEVVMVGAPEACAAAWAASRLAILNPLAWLRHEEEQGITIPHRWTFTSDSIAAHVASRLGAGRLTLLKSTLPRGECGPECAAGLGIVDEDFPAAVRGLPRVELVNLRSEGFERRVLQG
jgi:aspartokinase-like uncharacterized kinase